MIEPLRRSVEFGETPHRLDGWLIFMLDGASRAGLTPVPQRRLHLFLFFAAVLTPNYGLTTPVPLVLNYRHGPLYPEAQRALKRLIVMGCVDRSRVPSASAEGWSPEAYQLVPAGIELSDDLARTAWGKETREFAIDLTLGFSRLNSTRADEISREDALIRAPRVPPMETVDLRSTEGNRAFRTARWIANLDTGDARPSQRDEITLYLQYLQARRDKAAE